MDYKGYLIDLDGTMFRGERLIDGARDLVNDLIRRNIPYVFITNNSTYTMDMIVGKLNRLGIRATEENMLTSSMVSANHIRSVNRTARCYVIGETGLRQALENENLTLAETDCDYVVVGLDKEISYEKLAKASLLIQEGARFIITNRDAAIPAEIGLLPGNGAIAAAIAVSTGVEPLCVGKPESLMMDEAVQKIGVNKSGILMVGDNYETDIKAGLNADIDTLMVLTGYSTRECLKTVDEQPTFVADNLHEWLQLKKA